MLEYMNIVHGVASKFKFTGMEYDDLVGEGTVGLLEALKCCDLSQDRAMGYLRMRIYGYVCDAIRDRWCLIRIPKRYGDREKLHSIPWKQRYVPDKPEELSEYDGFEDLISVLPNERLKGMFRMRYVGGFELKEIGRHYNITGVGVGANLCNWRKFLRKHLQSQKDSV